MQRPVRVRASTAALCAVLTCAGCASDAELDTVTWQSERSEVGDTVSVRTIAGQLWPAGVEPVVDLTIGTLDGDEDFMFGNVFRMAEDHEGGVYVFDRQGPLLRHYDRFGSYVGAVGRDGQGPGEYASLSLGLVVDPEGTVFLSDWGNGRIARFSADGSPLDPWNIVHALTTTIGRWVFSDAPGRVLLRTREPGLLVVDDGVVVDTLLAPELPGVPAERGGPYTVEQYWAWHPDGYFVVGVSDDYSFDVRAPTATVRISRETEPVPVHPEEAAAWRYRFEWMDRRPNYIPPAGEWIPSHMPPFRGIDVAADGRIWVRLNTTPVPTGAPPAPDGQAPVVPWEQPHLYDVFEADGRYLGEVRFPDDVEPRVFGATHIWGIQLGAFDEQYVVRVSLDGTR